MFANLRTILLAGLVTVVLSGAAFAGQGFGQGGYGQCHDSNYCQPQCSYKWITTYECRTVPYQVCIVKYDHCGNPYKVYVTKYREIQVPVRKLVKYCPEQYGHFAGGFDRFPQ